MSKESHTITEEISSVIEENINDIIKENKRLFTVLGVNAILSANLRLDAVLDALLEKVTEVCESQASSLMLLDEDTQELYFYTIKGNESESLKNIRLKLGEGISGWVAQHGKPVLVEDALHDKRFSRKADQKSHFQTRTMMCVPLMVKGRVLGTIQVLNRQDGLPFNNLDLRIFTVLANQAAVAIENAHLHEMATVDAMTGLYMKDYFMARLNEEYLRSLRSNNPISIIMSDIDLFKKVNDNFGHQGGDTALVALAHIINDTINTLKKDDIAGRYGGEEFCILLPGRDEKNAKEIAELIRKNIEQHSIPIGEHNANITISIGIASFPFHKKHIEKSADFIRLADEALYLCKNRGRNCVSLYE